MKITYYDSGWPINIGNAFIDMGSVCAMRQAAPQAEIYHASEMSKWLPWVNQIDASAAFDVAEVMETDYLVVSGMTLCDEFIEVQGPALRSVAARGVKIVFSGCGGYLYTPDEIDHFKRFLGEIKPYAFVSRDRVSFGHFKDFFSVSYDGIDCAFFVSEAFKPAKLTIKDYVVFSFDHEPLPQIDTEGRPVIWTWHECFSVTPPSFQRDQNHGVLSSKWPFWRPLRQRVREVYKRRPMMTSDVPDDYLHLFANAHATYSNRVHACIPTLAYGNIARLYTKSPRSYLFERAGVGEVLKTPVRLDQAFIAKEKAAQISFLSKVFTS